MASIKLRSITFDSVPFRKLKDMKVPLAERMTVIAGHNGIGKSTIMALIANCSGFSSSPPTTYMDRAFQANLFDIVHIDYEREYLLPHSAGLDLPQPMIEYLVNDRDALVKACSLTGRSDSRRARVVPRNVPLKDFESEDRTLKVGRDAKVPLPTIYLGMTRMLPVGESNPSWVKQTLDKVMPEEDKKFLSDFINKVIGAGTVTTTTITTQKITGTGKASKHPEYPHSSLCVSLGQDSLSAIATAVASFQKLKREMGKDYLGGLFVVDEIDAGFHPRAQQVLVEQLLTAARRLDLQIIATTHSMVIVEAVHPDSSPRATKRLDGVVYLMDRAQPYVAENFSLANIRDDMSLVAPGPTPKPKKKVLKVYFEDDEAAFFFDRAAPRKLRMALGKQLDVTVSPMPLGVGCGNLIGLAAHDPYFKQTILAVDADAKIGGGTPRNVVRLPGAHHSGTKGMSPERTIVEFAKSLVKSPDKHASTWEALKGKRVTVDHVQQYLVDTIPSSDKREPLKTWWKENLRHIEHWELTERWMEENADAVAEFHQNLTRAATAAVKKL